MAENRGHGKGAIGSPDTLQPTSAFSRFPPVHRADLVRQQRVDSGPLASKPMVLTEENIRRTIWHGQPGLPRPLPFVVVRIACRVCSRTTLKEPSPA
jgi:hypothetical protein